MRPQRIVLELVPLADERPVEIRLRNLLKTALRRDRLKCVRATTAPDGQGRVSHEPGGPNAGPPPQKEASMSDTQPRAGFPFEAARKVVEYLYDDERDDYRTQGLDGQANHIFLAVEQLDNWLKSASCRMAGFLVVGRGLSDDVPLRLCATREEAGEFIENLNVGDVEAEARDVNGVAIAGGGLIAVVEFRDGAPMPMRNVCDLPPLPDAR
jgi:hypothetical protein